MTRKRIIEIIEMIIEWLDNEENCKEFKAKEIGICMITWKFQSAHKITEKEEFLINEFIYLKTENRWKKNECFIFKPGSIKPRLKYLNKLLEILKQ